MVDARQRFTALVLGVIVASFGGLVLAAAEGTLTSLPGLLLLVPGAIALRGNVFGAMGSRLGTAVHAGTFRMTVHRDGVVGQNLIAAAVLTVTLSTVLAVLAKSTTVVFGLSPAMTLAEFVVVSTLGGLLASVALAAVTMSLAAGSVRFGWDFDNVIAPLVTTLGDLLTVPALVIMAVWVDRSRSTDALAIALALGSTVALLVAWRTPRDRLRGIVRQSVPVLGVAAVFDLVAGLTLEKRLDDLLDAEVVLVLLPAFLGAAGALGAILSSRLSTQFHLGLDDASPLPSRSSIRNITDLAVLGMPVFLIGALMAHLIAHLTGQSTPGLADLIVVTLIAGVMATMLMVLVAYYTTMGSFRLGLDPDTYGIPTVTSTLDLVGVFTLVLAMATVGVI